MFATYKTILPLIALLFYTHGTAVQAVIKPDPATKIRTVDVTRYGAKAGDDLDDTQAVLDALEECKKGDAPAVLLFPKGRYQFQARKTKALFGVDGAKGLTVDAQGSEFVIDGLTGLFSFKNSQDIAIKNLSVDFVRAPFSEGRVIEVKEKHFDVKIDPAYPVSGGESVYAYMDFDPKTRLPIRHGLDEYFTVSSTQLLSPQVLRVNLKNDAAIKKGSLVLLRHYIYDRNLFTVEHCDNASFRNIAIRTAPGMAAYVIASSNIAFDRIRIAPKPATKRLMSTTADGLHIVGCRGTVSITNSEFVGMGDDAVNIYPSLYLTALKELDGSTIMGAHNLKVPDPPGRGDTVELLHQEDMLRYATAVVKSVEYIPAEIAYKVEFTKPLPLEFKTGDVIGSVSRVARVRIANCRVERNRARGFLVQGSDITVEKNRFINCTSGGVWACPEVVFFYQGSGSNNITIRDNTFRNCNYAGPLGESVISVYAYLNDFKYPTKPGIHKNILIENNTISGSDDCAIFLAGVDGASVLNNRIENACRNPKWEVGHSAIHILGSRNLGIENNTALPDRQGEECKSVITLGPGTDTQSVKITRNHGFKNTR